jgi:hypothetical protein
LGADGLRGRKFTNNGNRRSLHNLWLCKGEWKGQRGIYGAMALEGARGE